MLKSTFGEIAMKSRQRQKDILFSLIVFFSAFTVNLLIQKLFTTQTLVPMIFVFGVFLISLKTHGYCYGITSAIVSVFAVDFAFTYPYYVFGFFVEESILSAVIMLVVAVSTSTLNIRIRDQEKLRSENEKERMRGNLLRAISHDLRTPLTSIIGAASSYTENSNHLTEEEKTELVTQINDDANWLLNMVENLLTVTRIQNDESHVSTSLEVVEEVVSEAVQRLRKRIPHAKINVSIPEAFLMVPMDPLLIEQVIMNLLENAVIHSESKQAVDLVVTDSSDSVTFHVIDYGKGLDEDKIPSLFEGQSASGSSDSHKGMGIGLSICKTIIQAHNGTICAFNHENGAEFSFTLPKEGIHES